MTASRTLFVEVWGYDHPCSECQHSMTWVFGLRPWYRPAIGELVTCDKPMAVNIARELLERDGSGDLAAQLKPRPVGARGASFNPNTCTACGDQADWHTLDGVIVRALHDDVTVLARARVEVTRWHGLTQERTYVIAI